MPVFFITLQIRVGRWLFCFFRHDEEAIPPSSHTVPFKNIPPSSCRFPLDAMRDCYVIFFSCSFRRDEQGISSSYHVLFDATGRGGEMPFSLCYFLFDLMRLAPCLFNATTKGGSRLLTRRKAIYFTCTNSIPLCHVNMATRQRLPKSSISTRVATPPQNDDDAIQCRAIDGQGMRNNKFESRRWAAVCLKNHLKSINCYLHLPCHRHVDETNA